MPVSIMRCPASSLGIWKHNLLSYQSTLRLKKWRAPNCMQLFLDILVSPAFPYEIGHKVKISDISMFKSSAVMQDKSVILLRDQLCLDIRQSSLTVFSKLSRPLASNIASILKHYSVLYAKSVLDEGSLANSRLGNTIRVERWSVISMHHLPYNQNTKTKARVLYWHTEYPSRRTYRGQILRMPSMVGDKGSRFVRTSLSASCYAFVECSSMLDAGTYRGFR